MQDIAASVSRGKDHLKALRERNNALMDPLIAVHLMNLTDVMATIEVISILALSGEYKQERVK